MGYIFFLGSSEIENQRTGWRTGWHTGALAGLVLAALCLGGPTSSMAQEGDGAQESDAVKAEVAKISAARIGRVTGLNLPRYVSLKKTRVNVRLGPGESYAVKWVFVKQNLPVEVIAEHEHWRKIRDRDGEEGWVHFSLLDGRRYGIVEEARLTLWKNPGQGKNRIVAYVEPQVILRLKACSPAWCRVEIDGYRGWVERSQLWGLYTGEIFS